MAEVVLDASAALAYLHGEAGGAATASYEGAALISTVNLSEVVAKLIDLGRTPAEAETAADAIPCTVESWDRELAVRAGVLRAATRRFGLSLGDRACLALAEREGLPVLTGDRRWADLDIGVEVRLIR